MEAPPVGNADVLAEAEAVVGWFRLRRVRRAFVCDCSSVGRDIVILIFIAKFRFDSLGFYVCRVSPEFRKGWAADVSGRQSSCSRDYT